MNWFHCIRLSDSALAVNQGTSHVNALYPYGCGCLGHHPRKLVHASGDQASLNTYANIRIFNSTYTAVNSQYIHMNLPLSSARASADRLPPRNRYRPTSTDTLERSQSTHLHPSRSPARFWDNLSDNPACPWRAVRTESAGRSQAPCVCVHRKGWMASLLGPPDAR